MQEPHGARLRRGEDHGAVRGRGHGGSRHPDLAHGRQASRGGVRGSMFTAPTMRVTRKKEGVNIITIKLA